MAEGRGGESEGVKVGEHGGCDDAATGERQTGDTEVRADAGQGETRGVKAVLAVKMADAPGELGERTLMAGVISRGKQRKPSIGDNGRKGQNSGEPRRGRRSSSSDK